jgi:hypothetical protein
LKYRQITEVPGSRLRFFRTSVGAKEQAEIRADLCNRGSLSRAERIPLALKDFDPFQLRADLLTGPARCTHELGSHRVWALRGGPRALRSGDHLVCGFGQ